MQEVSNGWKLVQQKNILPQSNIKLTYRITNVDGESKISGATAADKSTYSVMSEVYQEIMGFYDYASFELNKWVLDGSCQYFPTSAVSKTGYISNSLSANDATYGTALVLEINFSQVVTSQSIGTTIRFSEDDYSYATNFTVVYTNSGTAVKTISVTNNTKNEWSNEEEVSGYDKLTITITKWNTPFTRARIEQVYLGINTIFEANQKLMKFEHSRECSIGNLSLSSSSIKFEIDNSDGAYNPDNPTGIYSYITQKQKVKVEYGVKVNGAFEYIPCGVFYMAEWNTPQNSISATFTAKDLIYFMGLVDYDITKNFGQSFPINTTIAELVEDVFDQSNVPTNQRGDVFEDFEMQLSFNTEIGLTCASVLQIVGNAIYGFPIAQDREGVITILQPNTTTDDSYTISRFLSYKLADYDIDAQCSKVVVNDDLAVFTLATNGEVQKVENPLFDSWVDEDYPKEDMALYSALCLGLFLQNRKRVSGEFRPDVRLDLFDNVWLENKYTLITEQKAPVVITSLKFTYDGGWKGTYEGRIMTNWNVGE